MKKDKKEIYCSFEHFMKYKCNGCKLERECQEWDKRNRTNSTSNSDDTSINKEIKKG